MRLVITRAGSALIQDGVNTFIFELSSAMLERGIDVSVLSGCGQAPGTDPSKLVQYVFDVDRMPSIAFLKRDAFQSVLHEIAYWAEYGSRMLRELQPSMIIMNGVFPLISRAFRIAVCHGLRNQGAYPLAQKYYDYLMYRTVDCLVAVSEPLKKEIELELRLKNVTVIPIGLDTRKYETPSLEERDTAILHVGTRTVKNLRTTLHAFEMVTKEIPEARLLVTGSKNVLKDTISQTIRDKVSFLGIVPKQELRRLYSKAIVVLAPSYYEAFHYATLEAFASGTPTIGSEAIPKQLLIDNFNGRRISSPDNQCQLARYCIELLVDAARWRYLSRNARATALKYDIGRSVDLYMTLADKLGL
jgi:glycosyltransferase involved in cell wall biosynthesis